MAPDAAIHQNAGMRASSHGLGVPALRASMRAIDSLTVGLGSRVDRRQRLSHLAAEWGRRFGRTSACQLSWAVETCPCRLAQRHQRRHQRHGGKRGQHQRHAPAPRLRHRPAHGKTQKPAHRNGHHEQGHGARPPAGRHQVADPACGGGRAGGLADPHSQARRQQHSGNSKPGRRAPSARPTRRRRLRADACGSTYRPAARAAAPPPRRAA
jgi:hypothetical protein